MKGIIFSLAFLCLLGLVWSMPVADEFKEHFFINQELEANSSAAGPLQETQSAGVLFGNNTEQALADLERLVEDFEALEKDFYVTLKSKGLTSGNTSMNDSNDESIEFNENGNVTQGPYSAETSPERLNFELLTPADITDYEKIMEEMQHFYELTKILQYMKVSDLAEKGQALSIDKFLGDEATKNPIIK